MVPVKLFLYKPSPSYERAQTPQLWWNSPRQALLCKYSSVSELRFPSSDGVVPIKQLLYKDSTVSELRPPSTDGINPVRKLNCILSISRWEREPREEGNLPRKFVRVRSKAIMQHVSPDPGLTETTPQVMPCHWSSQGAERLLGKTHCCVD